MCSVCSSFSPDVYSKIEFRINVPAQIKGYLQSSFPISLIVFVSDSLTFSFRMYIAKCKHFWRIKSISFRYFFSWFHSFDWLFIVKIETSFFCLFVRIQTVGFIPSQNASTGRRSVSLIMVHCKQSLLYRFAWLFRWLSTGECMYVNISSYSANLKRNRKQKLEYPPSDLVSIQKGGNERVNRKLDRYVTKIVASCKSLRRGGLKCEIRPHRSMLIKLTFRLYRFLTFISIILH